MTFVVGLALTCAALVIWIVLGRRPQVLRTLADGRRVLGPPTIAARPALPDDAPHVRRIAREPAPDERLATILPGAVLDLRRDGGHWVLADGDGRVAHVGRAGARPGAAGDALTAATSDLPDRGHLWVDRVLQDADGRTIDLRGVVEVDDRP